MMRQASRLQRKVAVRKEELKSATVEAGAGNDRVKVVVTGARELASISIDPQLLKEEDLGMVQDLIVAAVNAGMVKSTEMVEAEIEKVTGGVSIPGLM
jgi:DNA-binding YbaB/EbfC family protein